MRRDITHVADRSQHWAMIIMMMILSLECVGIIELEVDVLNVD